MDGEPTVSAKDDGPGKGALSALVARKKDLTSTFCFVVVADDADGAAGAGDAPDDVEAVAEIDTADVVEDGGAGFPFVAGVGAVVGSLSVIVPKANERASFLADG